MTRLRARGWAAVALLVSSVGGGPAVAAQDGAGASLRLFNVADTNSDHLSDTLWVGTSPNRLVVCLMRGTRVIACGPDIAGPPGEGWDTATAADFNRDGYNDVIWTNARRGTMAVWLLRGAQLLAAGPEIPGPPGEGWSVANASDTNYDGMADAVWYNATTNRTAVFLMNGTQLLAPGPEMPGPPGDGWHVTNVADTNADGRADIIWDNPKTNVTAVWLLDGTRLLAAGDEIPGPPGEGWTAVTAADFNRDGYSDVIWSSARGTMAVWLLRGTQLLAAGPEISGPPGEGWAVAYAGDTNGDELADAVWQKSRTTQFAVYLMNGARLQAEGPVAEGP